MAAEGDALGRARQLARSGCTDPEIAAVLEGETDLEAGELEALLAEPAIAGQLERQRLAGRAFFRDYVFRAATPTEPTAATLQLAAWLSRQTLGFTTQGVDGEIKAAADELDGLTNDQLADRLEAQAADLRGKATDAA